MGRRRELPRGFASRIRLSGAYDNVRISSARREEFLASIWTRGLTECHMLVRNVTKLNSLSASTVGVHCCDHEQILNRNRNTGESVQLSAVAPLYIHLVGGSERLALMSTEEGARTLSLKIFDCRERLFERVGGL